MRRLGAILVLLALAGCATRPAPVSCPSGQAEVRTAQLFVGSRSLPVTEAEVRRFVDKEITPRFPDGGVTIVNGGGQWTGDENRLIREANKVVLIVLPSKPDAHHRVEAVRHAYRVQFKQSPVVVVPPPACAEI